MNIRLRCFLLFALWIGFSFAGPAVAQAANLPEAPEQICPLPISSTLPSIELKTLEGKPIDLNQQIKERPSILIYFRGGW